MDAAEKDTTGILYSRDAQRGLAFVSAEGFHEGGMDKEGVLALTMLRSFSRVFLADEPHACRLIGKHTFHYAIIPLSQKEDAGSLLHLQEQLAVALPHQLGHAQAGWGKSMLKLTHNRLMVSAIKPPEDGEAGSLIVRLWNPCCEAAEDTLEVGVCAAKSRQDFFGRAQNGTSVREKEQRIDFHRSMGAGDASFEKGGGNP